MNSERYLLKWRNGRRTWVNEINVEGKVLMLREQ
jgi:hypothetical protein